MKRCALLFSLLSAWLMFPAQAGSAASPAAEGEELSAHVLHLLHRSNGVYSALEAAAAGDVATLQARLMEGENPEQVDEKGYRPIHYAVLGGSLPTLQLLLEAGADPLARDAHGRTPRELCQQQELISCLKQAEGVRAREREMDAMIAQGNVSGVRAALAEGVNPNARTTSGAGCVLHHAVTLGHADIALALMEAGAKVNAITPEHGLSALHIAAAKGDARLIRMLLAAKANPLLQAANGAYPLHDAIWNRHVEAVRALLPAYAQLNFNPRGGPHGTPLAMAIHYGRTDIVRAFLEAGFNPNDARLADAPPLILAVRSGHADCVKLLLDGGADRQARDRRGKMAVDYASDELASLLR